MIENHMVIDGYWNEPEPQVVLHCDECDCEIYVGDEFYDTDAGNYCERCADEYFCRLKCECRETARGRD